MSATWMRVLATAALVVGGLACGSEEVTVPTAAQLAGRLIDAGTFDGTWTVNAPEIPADDEGPGFAEEMPLPAVGDDRYGAMLTMEEAGGWAEWRLHVALVRDGAVLVWITIVDIRAGDDPFYTVDEIGRMVETAVDLL